MSQHEWSQKCKMNTRSKVPAFLVFLVHIQSECGKMWARKTLNTDIFHAVDTSKTA